MNSLSIVPRSEPNSSVNADQRVAPHADLLKTRRLVVVDDDEAFRISLCDLLHSRGYPMPESCSGGRDLISLLMEGAPFDLVLLDLTMPDLGGLDVLRMLRQAKLEVAVVVVSGDRMMESAIGALRLGANDYVRKPYAPEMLLHTVETVLRRHDLEKSHRQMTAQLECSERMHRFLVNTSPDLIFTLDEAHNFSFVSDRVGQLIGCTADELAGLSFFSIIFEEDVERTRYLLDRVGKGECSTELRLVSREHSSYRHFDVKLIPVEFSDLHLSRAAGPHRGVYVVARDISDKKLADDHLAYLAYHDVLTGLPNRALFRDRVGLAMVQAKRSGMKAATMFVDLDRFKLANDTFGHQKGDELLKEVARRLQDSLRETDTLARIGGDEFTVLLPCIRSTEDAAHVAGKLVADMARPYLVSDNEVFLTASIGISIWPEDGDDIETLMRHADLAMYHVKSTGKNNFGFFSSTMGQASSRRLSFENELRHGFEDEQFELYYQPQVDAESQQVVGLEALVRWRHPAKGVVSPGHFIPVVEEIGLMPALTYWVLETACRDLRDWWERGFDVPRMSINVSPAVLDNGDFSRRLEGTLKKYAIPHENFEIEITENIFVGDRQKVSDCLLRISQKGIRIAIDDFGTQYSSLSYLRYLPVSTLKIDQSFVREIDRVDDSSPIVRAIIAIAAGLNLNVVAEGVETEVQAEFLRRLGCREMQGYLYGRPLPVDALERLLTRVSPRPVVEIEAGSAG
ncbi:MAG: diguanylate cyclase [Proteobacteria bacterium]|nr:diguanylate cyclase [Pseudomonadota bacterium]